MLQQKEFAQPLFSGNGSHEDEDNHLFDDKERLMTSSMTFQLRRNIMQKTSQIKKTMFMEKNWMIIFLLHMQTF